MVKKIPVNTPPPPSADAQTVLDWDLTEFRFPGVYMMSYKTWSVDASAGIPHGVRYAFNLFAPDAQGEPINPILRFDNDHAPDGIKTPFDHWHPPKRGPGGWPIGVDKEQQLREPLADLPVLFFERGLALLKEMKVDVDNVSRTVGPSRLVASDDKETASPTQSSTNIKPRRKK